jgi:hypothetical protein
MGLDAALDRFWEVADARRLGIDAIHVVADDGPHGERRRIDDIRRDVFSVSKTETSLVIGPTGCMCGCALATGLAAWTASTGSSGSCSPDTARA